MTPARSRHPARLLAVLCALTLATTATAFLWHRIAQDAPAPRLAAWAPSGALLSIESPDFAHLVARWQASPEQRAWLSSDNYAAFSRSRLFDRLQAAQADFAAAAGLPVDNNFLAGIAGDHSFFAWYDIGQLQVVYITHMTPDVQRRSQLLAQTSRFSPRESGGIPFFVHTASAKDVPQPANDAGDTPTGNAESRTVAFATHGDWLILATDETLMARTLELVAAPAEHTTDSLATQPWYTEAMGHAPANPGELRLALDLSRIVRSPYFRTYWIQQNITELSRFRAALCDLYEDPDGFHEDRVLLPTAPLSEAPANADLSSLTGMVPADAAVVRASAHPSAATVLAALNEKLLRRSTSGDATSSTVAPSADFATPQAGSPTDLETRIDTPAPNTTAAQDTEPALSALLASTPITALLTLDTHNPKPQTPSSTWVPFHSAVLFEAAHPLDRSSLEQALTDALRPTLTAGTLGITWHDGAPGIRLTSDAQPLALACRQTRCVLADDPTLLAAILASHAPTPTAPPALLTSSVNLTAARDPFFRWSSTVDGLNKPAPAPTDGSTPPFFSRNLASLARAFPSLKTEQFTARQDGELLRQQVAYRF